MSSFLHHHHPVMMDKDFAVLADGFIKLFIEKACFDGWTEENFEQTINEYDENAHIIRPIFPSIPYDLLWWSSHYADSQMLEDARAEILQETRISRKIYHCVKARFLHFNDQKIAIKKAATLLSLPHLLPLSLKLQWQTSDKIWSICGDHALDFNYYTKRATLCAVMNACYPVWFQDDTQNCEETLHFLENRLKNVGQFHKAKQNLMNRNPLKYMKDSLKAQGHPFRRRT